MKSRKFEQSCISDRLSVSADISDPVSVIRISAKFHIGASLYDTGHASATSDAILSVVTTLPVLAMYLEHALEKLVLKDLKNPTSSGCKMWVV